MRVIGMRGVIGVRLLGLLGLLELLGLLGPAVADVALVAALVVTALVALVGAGGPGLAVADVLVVALGRADVLAVRLGATIGPVCIGAHGHGGMRIHKYQCWWRGSAMEEPWGVGRSGGR